MIGYAFSLIISSPLADRFGIKKIMIISTINYCVTALICAFADNMTLVIIARLFQSMSGGSGTILGRVETHNYYNRISQIKALSYFLTVTSLSSTILPITSSYINELTHWRIIFVIMAIISFITLILIIYNIRDDNPITKQSISLLKLGQVYKELLTNKYYAAISFVAVCTWCNYFIYLGASPFIYREYLGATSSEFAVQLAITSGGYLVGTIIVRHIAHRYALERIILWSCGAMLITSIVIGMVIFIFSFSMSSLVFLFSFLMIFLGLILPCCQALILDHFPHHASNALALFFFLQYLASGLGTLSFTYFNTANLINVMALFTIICAILRFGVYYFFAFISPFKKEHINLNSGL
jgi:DHA1 family bicyclomycin/chloramphenicol resistance-like MFS transporter